MIETLIAKVGRETFQGIANRQGRAVERRPKRRSRTARMTRGATENVDDYLHIFFHPDSDRRLWLRTRSADPATAFDTLRT
ncbi:hypothetical protein J2797_003225 [Paraburkholderia terricola]|jgi:hypothetical protein|nr:hypothetical protein [Paraburkholderia terricola]